MSLIECECQAENGVPVDSMGDFVCPKFSVRDMIKLYEEGKKSPSSSGAKSLTPSIADMHIIDYSITSPMGRNGCGDDDEILVEKFEKKSDPLRKTKKVKDDKKYRSRTRILPTRNGIRIITDVYVNPK